MEINFPVEIPFLVRPENIARYEDGTVWILDRRVYPFEKKFVRCKTFEDVARAIEEMVTQSGGPGYAAGYGMVQAAHQARNKPSQVICKTLETAANRLINTRPTYNHIRLTVEEMLRRGLDAVAQGENVEQVLMSNMDLAFKVRDEKCLRLGKCAADLIIDGDRILNHCWADHFIIFSLLVALSQGKKVEAFCTETRPYLQGARLTADAIAEMGIPTTVITDNMPAYLMSKGLISIFFAGADRVTMQGHVINKIGTFQIALCAHHFGIPFYTLCFGPDPNVQTPNEVIIEERNPDEVLYCQGLRTATYRAKGYYPAFDVTPPEYVSALVTDRGGFSPYLAGNYYLERNNVSTVIRSI